MAISPDKVQANFEKEVEKYEKEFDEALEKSSFTNSDTVYLSIPKGMTRYHYIHMRKNYIAAGWKDVNWVSADEDYNQRECIGFTKKQNTEI